MMALTEHRIQPQANSDRISFDDLHTRFHSLRREQFIDGLRIEVGTMEDYKSLARFHYRGGHPGAVTAVFRIVHRTTTVVGRFLGRDGESQIVGVLVRSLPQLACRLRDLATNDRYRGLKLRDAAVMLNREVRTISRVVIDPQWRGTGLAVKLVRHALANPEPGVQFTEALAVMGRVSPFFEHAGMLRYDRPPRPEHARLADALTYLRLDLWALARSEHVTTQLDPDQAAFLLRELRRWHRAAHRTPKSELEAMTVQRLIAIARDELLSQPVYYLYQHKPQ